MTTATQQPDKDDPENPSLSGGAIAGIVIGALVLGALVALGCFLCYARRHRKNKMRMGGHPGCGDVPPGANRQGDGPWGAAGQQAVGSHSSTQMAQAYPAGGGQYAANQGNPIELEAAPGSTVWRGADGVTYGLLAPAGSVSPTQSQFHDVGFNSRYSQQPPYSPTGTLPPLPAYCPSANSPLGPGAEIPPTKVDSTGRVWVALSPTTPGGNMTPGDHAGDDAMWYNRGSNGYAAARAEPQELPGHYHHMSSEEAAEVSATSPYGGGGKEGIKKSKGGSITASSGVEPRIE